MNMYGYIVETLQDEYIRFRRCVANKKDYSSCFVLYTFAKTSVSGLLLLNHFDNINETSQMNLSYQDHVSQEGTQT